MKLERHREDEDLVNMTPLIDVVFILLIFFMLAGAIKRPVALPVDPPQSSAQEEGDEGEIVVLVGSDGTVLLSGASGAGLLGERPVANDAQLVSTMKLFLLYQPRAEVQLKADANVDAARVITVMELLREAGALSLVLLTVGRDTDG